MLYLVIIFAPYSNLYSFKILENPENLELQDTSRNPTRLPLDPCRHTSD